MNLIVSDKELSLLIHECGDCGVRIDFGTSGTILKKDNNPKVFEKLDEIRDLSELAEYHPQFESVMCKGDSE